MLQKVVDVFHSTNSCRGMERTLQQLKERGMKCFSGDCVKDPPTDGFVEGSKLTKEDSHLDQSIGLNMVDTPVLDKKPPLPADHSHCATFSQLLEAQKPDQRDKLNAVI